MGTRADFYIMEDDKLEWLGSIAWGGYDIGNVAKATTKTEYRTLLGEFLGSRDDSTYPDDGWPWPWENSKLTDEIYIFIAGEQPFGVFGRVWRKFYEQDIVYNYKDHTLPLKFTPIDEKHIYNKETYEYEQPKRYLEICVPDMSHLKNVTLGKRSGLMVFKI